MQALQFQDNLMAMQGLQALANQCKQQQAASNVLPLPSTSPVHMGSQPGAPVTSEAVSGNLQQQLQSAIEQNQRMLSLLVDAMKPAGPVPQQPPHTGPGSNNILATPSLIDPRSNSPSSQLPSLAHIHSLGKVEDSFKPAKDHSLLALAGLSRDPSAGEEQIPSPVADNVDTMPVALRLLQSMSAGGERKEEKEGQVNQSRYWTDEEHQRFLEGVRLFGANNHKAIAAVVRTRNSAQVRSHSQKFFKKLETFDGQGLPSMTRKRKNVKPQAPAQPLSFITH